MAKDDSARRKSARGASARGEARDDEERPRRRPRDDDDDDEEEDRPRRRRARDDEEDEDRPRRRPRDEDEDEDEDERPRRRRPTREEEDEDEPRRKRRPRDEDEDEDSDEGDDDRPRKGSTRKKWEKVHLGLGFSIAAAAMLLGAVAGVVLSQVLFLIAGLLDWVAMLDIGLTLAQIGVGLYVFMEVPAVVGFALFLNTPNKKGAFPLAIVTLVIGAINLLVRIIFLVLPFLDQGSSGFGFAAIGVAGLIFLILGDAEFILFPLYMKAVMLSMRDRYLAESTNIPIALACGEIGFKIALAFIVSVKIVRGEGGVSMIATILGLVLLAVLTFFALSYLKTILAIRKRVATKLPAREDDMP